jgi:hypothetical protein
MSAGNEWLPVTGIVFPCEHVLTAQSYVIPRIWSRVARSVPARTNDNDKYELVRRR